MWEREDAEARRIKLQMFQQSAEAAEIAATLLRNHTRNLTNRGEPLAGRPEGISDLGQELA